MIKAFIPLSMEKKMNRKDFSLDKYWEVKLDFRKEEELQRYKILCNDDYSRKDKKCNVKPIYRTYTDWERYIQEKLSKLTIEELKEFQKYVNLKRTCEQSVSKIQNNFLLPFLIAVISPLIVQGVTDCYEKSYDSIMIYCVSAVILVFFFYVECRIMVKKIVLEEKESRRATLFYNDIYEIVQKKIIGNRSNDMYYE